MTKYKKRFILYVEGKRMQSFSTGQDCLKRAQEGFPGKQFMIRPELSENWKYGAFATPTQPKKLEHKLTMQDFINK